MLFMAGFMVGLIAASVVWIFVIGGIVNTYETVPKK